MVCKLFSVYDSKAECFMPPFMFSTIGQALRFFSDLVHDTRSQISSHPEDYTLYDIGEFDDAVGMLSPCDRKAIAVATEFLETGEPLCGSTVGQRA